MYKALLSCLIVLFIGFANPSKSFSIGHSNTISIDTITKENYLPLITYLGEHITYPLAARKSATQGNVLLSIHMNTIGVIDSINFYETDLLHKKGTDIDKEVIKVLKAFKDKKKQLPPGFYVLPITFVLNEGSVPALNPKILKQANCLPQVLISGYSTYQMERDRIH